MISYLFDWYQDIRLPFGAAQAGDVFQKKIDETVTGIPNVFGIVDDILMAGFDGYGKDHDEMLEMVLQIFGKLNLTLIQDKCLFRYTGIPFFGEIISW